ncbi:MAG TPA: hypothetical protein VNG12_13320 [Acidimicrobiales bacterium]|nr:hypothetical protein [Acidimicrobiales bacterium]
MEWSVLVETRAPEPVDDDRVLEQLGDLADALAHFEAAVGGDGRGWDVRLIVRTGDGLHAATEAVEAGYEAVLASAKSVGLPIWPVIRTEAVEQNIFHAQLEISNLPDFLGTTEVTELLGVSRQRLHQLRASGRFPDPAYEMAATPLWIRSTIDTFLAGWDRSPGRPNLIKWSQGLAADWWAYEEHKNDDASKGRQYPHQQDTIVHELVRRLGAPEHAATVIGIPIDQVLESLARPGLS